MHKKFYLNLSEAQQATAKLNINSYDEYKRRYKEDPMLPADPTKIYHNEWANNKGWYVFLSKPHKEFYSSFTEAKNVVISLGITSVNEYTKRYKENSKLPSNPRRFYSDEWPDKNGWYIFFGRECNEPYHSLKEAQQAVIKLNINSIKEYRERYSEDLKLPYNPNVFYSKEWPVKDGWFFYLGKVIKTFYPTLYEAKEAVAFLGINSRQEYEKRYKEDPRLPAAPNRVYSDDKLASNGWHTFFGKQAKDFYVTLAEAKEAALLLGINSTREYNKRYKEDLKLPSSPPLHYFQEWPTQNGWYKFFGVKFKEFYPTLAEAKEAITLLGITSRNEYDNNYKKDPKLPANPNKFYSKEWTTVKGWNVFFGKPPKEFYTSLSKAKNATIKLGITSQKEYKIRYKEDAKLPVNPEKVYSKEWPINNGWYIFFGKQVKEFYLTLLEAQRAINQMGITSQAEYVRRYKENPKLPSHPQKIYSEEWPSKNGWYFFLGKEFKQFYSTLYEARQAVKNLGMKNLTEYRLRYKEDLRLPSDLLGYYRKELPLNGGWEEFIGEKVNRHYETLIEAKNAVVNLGITSSTEYKLRYKEDSLLPATPHAFYASDWRNLTSSLDFYTPDVINSFSLLVQAVKVLNIKNSSEYRILCKKYHQLPSNPKRSFPDEFIDWYQLCSIPKPYSYLKLKRLVQSNKITTIAEYDKWRRSLKDPKVLSTPHESSLYKAEWVNWYILFGTEEPFQPKYIRSPYLAWRDDINEFMKFARGAGTKKSHLCKFVRLYVQKNQLGISPVDFVFNKDIKIVKFRELVSQEVNQSKMYMAIDEFIDFIVRTKCSDEDPDTGEIVRMKDAKNRIKGLWLPDETPKEPLNETVKPALSYQYVQTLRNWTMPLKAKTFSDLKHLHIFDADWIKVPIHTVDKNDPDCVFEIINEKFAKIWIPIYWIHAFTLFSVPLRGMQIAYNDSGEADAYIPEFDQDKLIWIENKHKLAGLTNNQGMIKRYPNDEFGMFSTSNKTSFNIGGQSVPWMPIELAYWLIKLRKWQSKYNPIKAPKAWLNCERTNLNELQRKQKGINCFLFRDFGQEECGSFSGRLASRLAAALYFSQPKGIQLAKCKGLHNAISKYESDFTPHSMRVSLITIYVMEYNLDLSIIMKIAGHSSIIMSIYYVKTQGVVLRKKVEEGEKIALKSQANATQSLIEQLRIDEIKPNLIGTSEETLKALSNGTPAGNYLFRDWGICPHAGTRCEDGGAVIGSTQARSPVPVGYLGGENCVRCRHFITGPAFIGGLLAIFQEIILYLEAKQLHYDELIKDEGELVKALDKEDENEYICLKKNEKFNPTIRKEILASIRKTRSEYEVVAKKMDMLYCDLGAVSTLVHQCQALLNQSNLSIDNDDSNLQLIVRPEHELQVIAEEVSQYELLCEVCENSEIYQSASADLAITPRTQLIDNMMLKNNLKPLLFTLTKKQQLKAGNQLNKLFKERLKSHVKVNDLIEGKLLLSDLEEHERIEPVDLMSVLQQQKIDIKEI